MVRFATLSSSLLLLAASLLVAPRTASAHSPEDSYSARADLRVDEQRGLRVRIWFEVPDSSPVAQGSPDAAVATLADCLELRLSGAAPAGTWRAGDDSKHGLSNGSHRLYALEFEPVDFDALEVDAIDDEARRSLDLEMVVELVVECFPDHDLAFKASTRARSPWRVADESLPAVSRAGHDHHSHSSDKAEGSETTDEAGGSGGEENHRVRVHFVRD